jgi:hypothetical protein
VPPKTHYSREELLALKPTQYLAGGFRDATGKPRHELRGLYATAAAVQLGAHQVVPQEMRVTYEAWKQALPDHEGPPRERARAALFEAFEIARAVMTRDNDPHLVNWLMECVEQVNAEEDIPVLLEHFLAATKQAAVFLALKGGAPA